MSRKLPVAAVSSILPLALTTIILTLVSCGEDSATNPDPIVLTEEVYDSIAAIGDEEAPTFWDERKRLGRAQAIQNLSARLAAHVDVNRVFPPGDVLLFFEHSSGLLSAIATDTIEVSSSGPRVFDRECAPAVSPGLISYRATMFDYPAWFGLPALCNPAAKNKAVLDGSALFGAIPLSAYSHGNLQALRAVPKDSRFIYMFPQHGDGAVFDHGRCGRIGPFMQLDHLLPWQDLDAATQVDVEACRILIVRGRLFQEIWLTNRFFTHYFTGFSRYPLVMISACNLLREPGALWKSMDTGGVGALVGYTAPMSVADACKWEPLLMEQIVLDQTLADAQDALHNAHASSWPLSHDGDSNWSLIGDLEVVATNPSPGAVNVPVTTLVAASFSTTLDPATVTQQTFLLSGASGTVTYSDPTAVFVPAENLAWNTQYTATITTGMKDLFGNAPHESYSWTFTTAEEPRSSCVEVREGPWEFCLMSDGQCILHFIDGNLSQSGCYVSYDEDAFFAGPVVGRHWSGENAVEQFRFAGQFSGTPASSFSGTVTLTDGSGLSAALVGNYGHIESASTANPLLTASGTGRNLRERLASLHPMGGP